MTKNTNIPLHLIPCGKLAQVKELLAAGRTRRRMLDLGVITGTVIQSLRRSPSGEPTAYEIRGAVIALRSDEASQILVELL
jgi:ferrous iron transport protein A